MSEDVLADLNRMRAACERELTAPNPWLFLRGIADEAGTKRAAVVCDGCKSTVLVLHLPIDVRALPGLTAACSFGHSHPELSR